MASAIEQHPNRQAIIDAILAGKPDTHVAKLAGVSRVTVGRFRKQYMHTGLDATMQAAKVLQESGLLADGDSGDTVQRTAMKLAGSLDVRSVLVARLEGREDQLTKMLKKAVDASDSRGYSNLLTVDCKRVELMAKLAGVLDSGPGGVNSLNIVVMMPEQNRQADGPVIQATCEPG